jgi:hypothetical protein
MHKLKIIPKPWEGNTEAGDIHAGKTCREPSTLTNKQAKMRKNFTVYT